MMLRKKQFLSDRFSNLPDEIAHHILSFLGLKDLTSVGSVSKKCREFYLSIPSLILDRNCCARNNQKVAELMCFWDRYMFQRGCNTLQRFQINWTFLSSSAANKNCEEPYRMISWIHNAVRCNVEELNLFFTAYNGFTFSLPSCLYELQSFKSLVVRCSPNEVAFQAPPVYLSCNLHYLQLNSVKVLVDERLCKWISSSCKYLRELHLIQVNGLKHINIQSLSLELFKFHGRDLVELNISGEKLASINISWHFFYSSPGNCSLKICAPNLRDLSWRGMVLKSQNLGKFLNLRAAEIHLHPTVDDNLSEVFSSICGTKGLGLNEKTMKAMTKEFSVQAPLKSICGLLIADLTSFSNDIVPIMASLLRRTSCLQKLVIRCKPIDPTSLLQHCSQLSSSGFDVEYWKSQNLTVVNHLVELSIDLSIGSNGIEFAKYIVENAPRLNKIVIRHRPGFQKSDSLVERVTRWKNISRAVVVIQEIR